MPWNLLQTTLGSAATQLAPPANATSQVLCRQVIIQNNATHTMRLGDSSVTSSKGIYLAVGPGGGSFNTGPSTVYNSYLSDFWVVGTSGDTVDIFYNT
jgi:hypothetical protein